MAKKAIKPKPGKYRGVQYRSQLEIAWAKWFDSRRHDRHNVCYADEAFYDFAVESKHFPPWLIEVKPTARDACLRGIEKIDWGWVFSSLNIKSGNFVDESGWAMVIGQPPSCYQDTWYVRCSVTVMSGLYGPFESLAAVMHFGSISTEAMLYPPSWRAWSPLAVGEYSLIYPQELLSEDPDEYGSMLARDCIEVITEIAGESLWS